MTLLEYRFWIIQLFNTSPAVSRIYGNITIERCSRPVPSATYGRFHAEAVTTSSEGGVRERRAYALDHSRVSFTDWPSPVVNCHTLYTVFPE